MLNSISTIRVHVYQLNRIITSLSNLGWTCIFKFDCGNMMNLCITFPTPPPLSFPALSFSALTVTNWQSDWVERRKQNQYKANIMYMKSKLILSPSHLSSVYFEGHFYRYGFLGSRKLSIHIKKNINQTGTRQPKNFV